jgi:xanthine dehydrogenase accessory factor
MVVFADGSIIGTIGGGKLEAEAIRTAVVSMESIPGERFPFTRSVQFNGADAASMDMICGGEVNLLFEFIDPQDAERVGLLSRIKDICGANAAGWFVVRYQSSNHRSDWNLVYPYDDTQDFFNVPTEIIRQVQSWQVIEEPGVIVQIERLDKNGTVVIFGAGHVAQPIAQLCTMVGFSVTVIDDRSSYANPTRFPLANRILSPEDITAAFADVAVDPFTYIVIVTRGHLQDHVVAAKALKTPAGYIGMIGSRRKWRVIQDALLEQGFQQQDLERIHTPIGLPIGAETPEEIGVSVVAEMIKIRADKRKDVETFIQRKP